MALAACLATSLAAQGSTLDFETVVLTGQQAPGAASGTVFGGFGTLSTFRFAFSNQAPAINAFGQTAFFGRLNGPGPEFANSLGIYSDVSGALSLNTLTGEQVPDADSGVVFANFGRALVLNSAGQTAFLGDFDRPGVGSANGRGIYNDVSGTLAPLVRTGDQAPGADSTVVFTNFGASFERGNEFVFNDSGNTAFFGSLAGTGLTESDNAGIYSDVSGTLTQVAREGAQVPGAANGVVFSRLPDDPLLNAAGQIVFRADVIGPEVGSTPQGGVFSDVSGALTQIALAGEQAPGADSGEVFEFFSQPVLNDSGHTAFRAFLSRPGVEFSTNDSGIYSDASGTLAQVAFVGDQAPGSPSGVVFDVFAQPVLSDSGDTAFRAFLAGPDVDGNNGEGIYRERSGVLSAVVRAGDQAPGLDSDTTFRRFDDFIFNAAGQIAVQGFLIGPDIDLRNDRGIYATGLDGELVEIIREGNLFDVNDDPVIEDLRTISSFSFLNGFGDSLDGLGSGFNDQGQVVFLAEFTDGSAGIFVSNLVAVPEPGTLAAMLSVAGLSLLRRRRG